MKKIAKLSLCVASISLILSACSFSKFINVISRNRKDFQGEGEFVERKLSYDIDFESVTIKNIYTKHGQNIGGFRFQFNTSPSTQGKRVNILAQENIQDEIRVSRNDDSLVISANSKLNYVTENIYIELVNFNLSKINIGCGQGSISEPVAKPSFSLKADESSHIDFRGYGLSSLDVILESASYLSLGNLEAESFNLYASGASKIESTGLTSNTANFILDGASSIKVDSGEIGIAYSQIAGASQLKTINVKATEGQYFVSGASKASVYVTDTLKGELSGASQLEYRGNPNVDDFKVEYPSIFTHIVEPTND